MSIADKITSIEGHLTADYEGLENLGADLTNVNKNIQNIRTCLDNIYTSLPKTTGEGSNLSLTTLKGRINVDDILGDTEQDTYEGYNLLPITATSQTISGITITINNDKTITLNGTSTNAIGLDLGHCALVSGSYKGNCETNATTNTYYIRLGEGEGGSSTWIANVTSNTTFTLSENKDVYARLVIKNGVTINNVKIYPMLYSGSTTKPYQQYVGGQASPNPTYPQEINVATGTQEVVVQNKNIYDSSYRTPDNTILCAGGTCTETNGVFTILCNRNDMYVWNVQSNGSTYSAYQNQLIDFTENTYAVTITNALFTKNFITFYDKDKKSLNYKQFTTNSFTFTKGQDESVPSTAKYFSLRFGMQESVSGTTYTTSVQIEVGSTATPYTPHQEQTKTLHLGDIELAKIGTYQDRIFETSGKNYINEANEISQGGTTAPSDTTRVSIRVVKQLKANTTYTFITNLPLSSFNYAWVLGTKVSPWGTQQQLYDSGWQSSAQHFTYTTTQDCYVNIPIRKSNNGAIVPSDISKYWFMIYEGAYDSNILYEPYGTDKWYIEKKIDKFNFDGTETIRTTDYSMAYTIAKTTITNKGFDVPTNTTNALSNCFGIVANQSELASIGKLRFGGTYVIFNYDNGVANPTAFKTLLDTTAYFYFPLATPTYTEITNENLIEELNELEKMMSYNGQTNISVSGNLPMLLSVSALKGE